ncbi:sulfotransferase [Nocardioides humi]|uniref:Sulfotransferase n=1 Tax=Nocardioides humi TaxID=449461 RepID=A0ABN2AZI0_9ACTN|nr:sulfotransferase [Nocardioides humi]
MSRLAEAKEEAPRWLKDVANLTTRGYGLATSSLRPGPDFLVIGTKRGGTTSLFGYLTQHPSLLGLFPEPRGRKSTDFFFKHDGRSERWYRSHFHTRQHRRRVERRTGDRPLGGEASPYYLWDPRVARRVHDLAPGVKAIALLRDPVERAWSHYQERTENGVEPLGFAAALAAEERRTDGELDRMLADPAYYSSAHDWYSYRARGVYLPQLENWLRVFPREQLLVLRSEDMYDDVQGTFDRVCAFLGVSRHLLPNRRPLNASRTRSSVPEPQRAELAEFYAPHIRRLEAFLGRDLHWTGAS